MKKNFKFFQRPSKREQSDSSVDDSLVAISLDDQSISTVYPEHPLPIPIPQPVTQTSPTPIPQPVTQTSPTPIPQPVTQLPPIPIPQPVTQPPSPSIPTLFHPNLIALADSLMGISLTHELASKLQLLAYKMNLVSEDLIPFTEHIQKLIPSYQIALAQLKDTPDILAEFITDCNTFTTQDYFTSTPTYEDFLQDQGIQTIKKQATILSTLYKLAPYLFDVGTDVNLMTLLTSYTELLPTLNNLMTSVQGLLSVAEPLRKDILSFAEALNQMKTNKAMAVNWNSQKPQFIKIRQELDVRRTKFLQDEDVLNQSILTHYDTLRLIHDTFRQHTSFLISIFEQLLEKVSPNPQIIAQRGEINKIIVSLVSVQNSLLSYINTLS